MNNETEHVYCVCLHAFMFYACGIVPEYQSNDVVRSLVIGFNYDNAETSQWHLCLSVHHTNMPGILKVDFHAICTKINLQL